ncbi:MAG: M16 family metallopeptidase [Phycisphaerales bacterium JB059]
MRRALTPILVAGLMCHPFGGVVATAQEDSGTLAPIDADRSLPLDPALVSGRLENGLRYFILENGSPPDRVELQLRIDVGSLDELDNERGVARFAEELTVQWARGGALDRLRARGLDEIEDLTSRTGYDATVFGLSLPSVASLDDGLSVLASMARGGLIDSSMVESTRRSIGAALRARGDGAARARAQWLQDLGGASLLGQRPPESDAEAVAQITPEVVAVFRKRWYVASNMTLLVVGSVDAEHARRLIEGAMGGLEGGELPERQDRGIRVARHRRAVVGSDPELAGAQLALLRIAPVREPIGTVGGLRRHVLEQTAMLAMEIRLRSAMSEGRLSVGELSVYGADLFRTMQYAQIAAVTEGESWRRALRQLCEEVARVRAHGFLPGEVREARRRMETRLEHFVDGRQTMPSAELIRWLGFTDARGHAWIDPERELALTRRILLEADGERLLEVFRGLVPEGEEAVLVSAPGGDDAPTREEVLEIATRALTARTDPVRERVLTDRLYERLPEPGQIVEISAHPPSGVWSAVLSNGVRAHHVRLPGDRVIVQLAISPPAREAAPGEGMAQVAAAALNEPALPGMGSIGVRRVLVDAGLGVKAWSEGGRVYVRIEGDPEHVESAMELGGRVVTDPLIEAPAFERWRGRRLSELIERERDPLWRAEQALREAMGAEEAPSVEMVRGITLERARDWLAQVVRRGQVEAAVVGNVSRTEAFELCERYLGSIAPRPAGAGGRPEEGGASSGGEGEIRVRVETRTPVAGVAVGVWAPDAGRVRETHLLSLGARVLEQRLTRALRGEMGVVDRATVRIEPGEAGRGSGLMLIAVETAPAWADRVARVIDRELMALSEDGPGEEELASVMRRVERVYLDAIRTPGFWAGRLCDMDQVARSLDDVVGVLDRHATFTPEQVREALRASLGTRPPTRVIASPEER